MWIERRTAVVRGLMPPAIPLSVWGFRGGIIRGAPHSPMAATFRSSCSGAGKCIMRAIPMQLITGALVGSYEILAPLGAGGMGEVYRARDPRIGREVAIKILPPSFADNADRLRRFQQEARAAGMLNHPNLLTVFELGTCDGAPFIVSELIEGWTLREVLNGQSSIALSSSDGTPKGALSVKRAMDFAVQLANGLAAAHDKGIVHRDLKPENVLITSDSRVKLLDFGLAKLLDDGALTEENTINQGTHPGVILGTVAYMSPEQVRGETVDHRSDIFSLGSVLYEMLAGTHPFRRDSHVETMNTILKEDSKTTGFLPPSLERIVRHALEKNPAHRFQSMRDVAFALETLSGSGESSSIVDKQKKAAVKKTPDKTSAVFHRLTFRRGFLMNARFAPDSSIIYGAAWDDQDIEIYSTVAGTRHSRSVGLSGADILSISGSGEMAVSLGRRYLIGWVSSGTLARIPLFGGAPREICENVQEAEWGPDGKNFLILRRIGESFRIEYPIGNIVFKSMNWISHPRFSPKGDLIAFFDHPLFGDDRGSLVVIDLEGRERFRSPLFPSTGGLAWTPKGDEVWIARERAETGRDIVAFTLSGKERTLLAAPGRYSLFDISKDGVVLLSFDYCRREIMAGKIGNQHDQNLSWFDWSFLTSITDDGTKIVFEEQGAFSRADGEYQIYVRSLDGSARQHRGRLWPRHFRRWQMGRGQDGESAPPATSSDRRRRSPADSVAWSRLLLRLGFRARRRSTRGSRQRVGTREPTLPARLRQRWNSTRHLARGDECADGRLTGWDARRGHRSRPSGDDLRCRWLGAAARSRVSAG
jgi:eukaryotic-like serine/threonine-protein kinase